MSLYTNRRTSNKGLYRTKRTHKGLKITNKPTNDNVKYGGINTDLTDASFRYTISEKRRTWVKNIYPGLEALTKCIVGIDWSVNYTATGLVTIKGDVMTGNPNHGLSLNKINSAEVLDIYRPESTDVTISIQVNDTLKPIFVGGICYEILNDKYMPLGVPDLHTVVDPTGDIDIDMRIPSYNIAPSESEKLYNAANALNTTLVEKAKTSIVGKIEIGLTSFLPLRMDTDINPIYGELLNAVFSKCATALGTLDLTALLPNATDFDISEYKISHSIPSDGVNVTDMFGFREQQIGKLHLVAYLYLREAEIDELGDKEYVTDMRLQLVAKFENDNVIDHCLEIIIPMTQNASFTIDDFFFPYEQTFCKDGVLSNGFKQFTITNESKNSMKVELNDLDKPAAITSIDILLHDNIDAYSGRVTLLDHKMYNHVGRLLYLFILIKNIPPVGAGVINLNVLNYFIGNTIKKLPAILTDGFKFAKLDENRELQKYSISMQDFLLAFAPVFLRVPYTSLSSWLTTFKQLSNRKSDKEIQANDAIKNYALSSDESKAATEAAYDRIINGTTSIGLGGSRNSRRRRRGRGRGRGRNRSKKHR